MRAPCAMAATVVPGVRADRVNGHDLCHAGLIFTFADSAFAFCARI